MSDAPPPPRGRGAALAMALKRKKELEMQAVGAAQEEAPKAPPQPKGRAAILQRVLQRRVGAQGDASTVTSTPASVVSTGSPASVVTSATTAGIQRPTPVTNGASKVEAVTKSLQDVSIAEREPMLYRGESGKKFSAGANYIRLQVVKDRGVFEYEVKFSPELDAKSSRCFMIGSIMRELETVKVFDGGHCLYLPKKITDTQMEFTGTLRDSNEQIVTTIIYKKQKSFGDRECLHLYNVLFKRIMRELMYTPMGRNYYNMEHKYTVPQHKLEVYPGFAVSVDEMEGGLLLMLDTQHRVLRTQNAYELLVDLRAMDPRRFKEEANTSIIGSCVFTRYNNKTYIIDDIAWDMSPKDTFPCRDGSEISFVDYYKKQYNLTINDLHQPLLINRKSVKVSGSADKVDRMVCLIPELSFLTGLTESMRNDFRVMKDVAQYTRVTPQQRRKALLTYLENVKKCEKAQQILADWGLAIDDTSLDFYARQLDGEMIYFGGNRSVPAGPAADWNGKLADNHVLAPVNIQNWIVFFTGNDVKNANGFVETIGRLSSSLGMTIQRPKMVKLPDDRSDTWVRFCKEHIDRQVQLAVFVCPSMRSDRYAVIKKVTCAQMPVASQVINSRTLGNPQKLRSIVLKIALQINAKLGGALWTVKIPFQGWMICGIDVYHGSPPNSVAALVCSLNDTISRYHSQAIFQDKELGDFYKMAFTKALETFKNERGTFPTKIVIIRDGVGDGQLDQCKRYEVEQFESVIRQFQLKTKLCFVVVQKRISQRIYSLNSRNGEVENPPAGTIVDHTITRRYLYDFYLIPQSVRQGTVNPTHYITLHDSCNLKPDHVQRLCYKLCHLYYNWPGTIKVPAPCQYAHKLAQLVGQSMKTLPSPELADKLWYL